MKHYNFQRQLGWVTVLLALLVLLPIQAGAKEATSFLFSNGKNSEQLTNTKEIHVTNDEINSSLSITEGGKEIFNRKLSAIKIASIEKVTIGKQQYAIVNYRYDGSSNALYFEVLKLDDLGLESIYTSDTHERARINLNNDVIVLEYPEYEKSDVMTEPSKIVTQEFSINGNTVSEGEKKVEKSGLPSSDSKAKIAGSNPSYAEINKILTEEALKANISPEILKAIAYQESGWQQYWETVPASIKSCKKGTNTLPYDGTNVKLGYDCIGVGIMQISDHMYMSEGAEKEAYINKLKNDIRFNITEGIKILKQKWNYANSDLIPTINDNDPMVIENWYFAILAYNGLLPRNNPLERPYSPYGAYQEEVMELIKNYSLIDINPFPTYKLEPYNLENGQMRFKNTKVTVDGPQHLSSQSLKKNDTTYVNVNGLNLRSAPGGSVIGSINKGTKVTITGGYEGNSSRTNQYVWLPIKTSSGQTGYVASSYLSPTSDYLDVYSLYGDTRYETGVSIANFGWHWQQPSSVVIGRGDLPIDALTGSVLASYLDSPLLLTQNNKLTASVEKELDRIQPSMVYILGGDKTAISPDVEKKLKQKYGEKSVLRIAGDTRYETAYKIADEVGKRAKNMDEIFITTGDESSSDSLAIAPYAGSKSMPILLTAKNKLNKNIADFIIKYRVNKVTIIGGEVAVSSSVEKELNQLMGTANVQRVSGATRFSTSTAIADKYYTNSSIDKLFVAQGIETADALAASPLGAKLNSPIILTSTDKVPKEIDSWIKKKIKTKPNLYFLGGPKAITDKTRNQFIKLVK